MIPETLAQAVMDAVEEADSDGLARILGLLAEAEARAWQRIRTEGLQHDPGGTAHPAAALNADVNLSAIEAARRLAVSRDWLYKNADKLPFARRIGRRLVFSARGLERWNRDQATTA